MCVMTKKIAQTIERTAPRLQCILYWACGRINQYGLIENQQQQPKKKSHSQREFQ